MTTAEPMAPKQDNSITITLSPGALEDFRLVATEKEMSLATYLRVNLETYHESPGFGALLRRMRAKAKLRAAIALLRDNPDGLSPEQVAEVLGAIAPSIRGEED